jgi:regulator of protease activity HflC (stomatin/prohibitin superfamily)
MNRADGDRQELIARSEGEKQKRINEAEGQAAEILSVAAATAEGISKIAVAIQTPGGYEAVNLRVAEQYIEQFGKIAKEGNTLILPSDLTDISSIVAAATSVIKQQGKV